jgi:hypothetical protein
VKPSTQTLTFGRLGIAEQSRGFCSNATWAGLDQMNVNKTSSWTDTTGPAGARGVVVVGNMSGGVSARAGQRVYGPTVFRYGPLKTNQPFGYAQKNRDRPVPKFYEKIDFRLI